ncbi:MAG: exosome complex RNA-binding protein Csl4 [Candidatus Altiarchaeales archaeon]|nr:exosome complex RNA-binding protein Csl4 [Candidatus Altiarchaeota archaeon]MCG2782257.1 exosome complex RNA-binding protein Csl4 [Candidatus Altiarchaeales archaeon]
MENDMKQIGDLLGTIEEFVPGKGTYTEDGKIYASIMGKGVVDRENHAVRVEGRMPAELEVGQVVFGDVLKLNKNVVSVIVKRIQGAEGNVDIRTGIYVSNIADEYVEKPESMFGLGDIVKAKVIKIQPGMIDISTKGDFGVVKAFCRYCRHRMEKSAEKNMMVCSNCERKDTRKFSKDYGNVENI